MVAAQILLVARKRWKTLAAIPLGMGLFVLPWIYVTAETGVVPGDGVHTFAGLMLGSPFHVVAVLAAFGWALGVWSDEGPGERAYHWSLPVERPGHDLIRVAVGGAWMLAVGAVGVLAWSLGGSLLSRMTITPGAPGELLVAASSVSLGYLMGAVPALVCDRPARWTVGGVLGYAVVTGVLMEIAKRWSWLTPLPDALAAVWTGELGLRSAVFAHLHIHGDVSGGIVDLTYTPEPGLALLLWVLLAAAAVVGLSFVHLERAKGAAG
ncbi:MAG: hypothetical protein Q8W44_04990 [Candidatus Palauibacterales bacterium]|nr:hypothetical protein [Candidatus Palauibacterales bacterium]